MQAAGREHACPDAGARADVGDIDVGNIDVGNIAGAASRPT
jgi:hypothetical protein